MIYPQRPCKQEENAAKYLRCSKEKKYQPRFLYPKKLFFKSKEDWGHDLSGRVFA
jgi:hypothetical protein